MLECWWRKRKMKNSKDEEEEKSWICRNLIWSWFFLGFTAQRSEFGSVGTAGAELVRSKSAIIRHFPLMFWFLFISFSHCVESSSYYHSHCGSSLPCGNSPPDRLSTMEYFMGLLRVICVCLSSVCVPMGIWEEFISHSPFCQPRVGGLNPYADSLARGTHHPPI